MQELAEAEASISLTQRREFLQLTLEERRQELARQAEQMVKYYESESERMEREIWQGGDIAEP